MSRTLDGVPLRASNNANQVRSFVPDTCKFGRRVKAAVRGIKGAVGFAITLSVWLRRQATKFDPKELIE